MKKTKLKTELHSSIKKEDFEFIINNFQPLLNGILKDFDDDGEVERAITAKFQEECFDLHYEVYMISELMKLRETMY